MKIPSLRIIVIEESEDSQFKRPESIFNKIIKANFPKQKKEVPTQVYEVAKEDVKVSLFVDDMIVYISNPKIFYYRTSTHYKQLQQSGWI